MTSRDLELFEPSHVPVMRDAVLRALSLEAGARVVDGTLGHGGHARAMLDQVGEGGLLVGLDRDPAMLRLAAQYLARDTARTVLVRARSAYLAAVVRGLDVAPVDAVLLDLGLCTGQLDDPSRGFSFRHSDAPLDMRMNASRGETVQELLSRVSERELAKILAEGGVPAPGRIARALVDARPLRVVSDLLGALRHVRLPARRHHPATLVFQALRIAVNAELAEIDAALAGALAVLRPGGRLAVLSYHSGEDRRVKTFLAREARGCVCPPALPRCGCGRTPRVRIVARGDGPEPAESHENPRARSARLRVGERL